MFFRRNNFGCFFYIYFFLGFKLRHSKYNPWGVRGCSGEGTRLPPMWSGFKSRRRRHMWVELLSLLLVLSLALRGFSPGTPVFPSPEKPTLSNSSSCWNARKRFNEFLELLNAPWVNKSQNFTRHLKARGLQLNGTLLLV